MFPQQQHARLPLDPKINLPNPGSLNEEFSR